MKNGFTIIELIISIFILSVALVGIFSAFSIMTILTSDTADRLTATYLAQEGMEIVRNIRETNWLKMDECSRDPDSCPLEILWTDGLILGCSAGGTGCEADYTAGTNIVGASDGMTPGLDFLCMNGNGFYYYDVNCPVGSSTKFMRKIFIDTLEPPIPSSHYVMKVIVKVSWNAKATILNPGVTADTCGAYNCITTEGTLYNWYNYQNQ